jgi:hypothetical protein
MATSTGATGKGKRERTLWKKIVLPTIGAAIAAYVAWEVPQVAEKIYVGYVGQPFGPFVVLGANDEGSSKQPTRGYLELKNYEGAVRGDHVFNSGTKRNYSGFLKNGFLVLAYRSDGNGYGTYFLASNSGDQAEYVGHRQVNTCPGQGFQVVKDCNTVLISAQGKDRQHIEDEGLKKFKEFLAQECREVRFLDVQPTKACPADKQQPLSPLSSGVEE